MAVRNLTDYVCATIAAISLYLLSRFAGFDGPMQLWLIAGISLVDAALLAAAGHAGVTRALQILRADVERTLRLLGCPSVRELDASYIIVPSDW